MDMRVWLRRWLITAVLAAFVGSTIAARRNIDQLADRVVEQADLILRQCEFNEELVAGLKARDRAMRDMQLQLILIAACCELKCERPDGDPQP